MPEEQEELIVELPLGGLKGIPPSALDSLALVVRAEVVPVHSVRGEGGDCVTVPLDLTGIKALQ